MQLKPIIKSKRNTVILHDLPEQIPQEDTDSGVSVFFFFFFRKHVALKVIKDRRFWWHGFWLLTVTERSSRAMSSKALQSIEAHCSDLLVQKTVGNMYMDSGQKSQRDRLETLCSELVCGRSFLLWTIAPPEKRQELHELFEKCPVKEKLKNVKPDVNSTVGFAGGTSFFFSFLR